MSAPLHGLRNNDQARKSNQVHHNATKPPPNVHHNATDDLERPGSTRRKDHLAPAGAAPKAAHQDHLMIAGNSLLTAETVFWWRFSGDSVIAHGPPTDPVALTGRRRRCAVLKTVEFCSPGQGRSGTAHVLRGPKREPSSPFIATRAAVNTGNKD
jgi:hypothetical protein